MKKIIIVLFMCLCLFGCKKEVKKPVIEGVTITNEAINVSKKYNIDLEKLKLDTLIIDANEDEITFYMKDTISDENRKENFKIIWNYFKTITDDSKVWDYYNPSSEWIPNMISDTNNYIATKVIIDSHEYKLTISQMDYIAYQNSSQLYSVYKLLFMDYKESLN